MKTTLSIFTKLILIVLLISSCKGNWTQEEKDRIEKTCIDESVKLGLSNPEQTCTCVLSSILQKYPDPNQFENLEMGEYGQILLECQGKVNPTRIIWPDKTQKAFVDSCSRMATQMNKAKPKEYCTCVLQNLMEKHPTNDDLQTISPKVMSEIGINCEASVGK